MVCLQCFPNSWISCWLHPPGDDDPAQDGPVQCGHGGGGGRGHQGPHRDDHEEDGRGQGRQGVPRGLPAVRPPQPSDAGGIRALPTDQEGGGHKTPNIHSYRYASTRVGHGMATDIVYSPFSTVYCILYTVYCIPYTIYCLLSTVYCLFSTVYCIL